MASYFTVEQCERLGLDPAHFAAPGAVEVEVPAEPVNGHTSTGGRLYVRPLYEPCECTFCGSPRAQWLLRVAAGFFRGRGHRGRDRYFCRDCARDFAPEVERAGLTVYRSRLVYHHHLLRAVRFVMQEREWWPAPATVEAWARDRGLIEPE